MSPEGFANEERSAGRPAVRLRNRLLSPLLSIARSFLFLSGMLSVAQSMHAGAESESNEVGARIVPELIVADWNTSVRHS